MNCPKCNAAMEAVNFEDIEVDRCTSCGGLWFDLREHEELKQRRGSETIDTGERAAGRAGNATGDITCPRCRAHMIRMVDHDQPHIWYEQCSTCGGAYFDAGEFRDFKKHTPGDLIRRWRAKARP
ncbi:MAG: zf-TFIIB domain-containing protein [Phycisphaerales bacterium]|nr:zf-TFIIB domain-containing protein [Phycisphaerales bacterium]